MNLSPSTQAILLLTAYFNKASKTSVRPLTNKEWGKFAAWLHHQSLKPETLLSGDLNEHLKGWSDPKITLERIQELLNRGTAMALALEKWSRAGLWVLTRSDPEYPTRLKKHLKTDSPPVLFGCGNKQLLNAGGVAVIGSRNTSEADLQFSSDLGKLASSSGHSIVSGGARGVDEAAMLGALDAEGSVIGIMADSLLRACSSKKYRQSLMNNQLVLISPFYPEAGFNAGNAMQRNKYIYCLSDAAVAVHSGTKGGTWTGALENLKKQWVPMWVKPTNDTAAGNAQLVAQGGRWLQESISAITITDLFNKTVLPEKSNTADLFASPKVHKTPETPAVPKELPVSQPKGEVTSAPEPLAKEEPVADKTPAAPTINAEKEPSKPAEVTPAEATPEPVSPKTETNSPPLELTLYQHFLLKLELACQQDEQTVATLVESLGLHKSQVTTWLKQALDEGKVKKHTKPVRYSWSASDPQTELI